MKHRILLKLGNKKTRLKHSKRIKLPICTKFLFFKADIQFVFSYVFLRVSDVGIILFKKYTKLNIFVILRSLAIAWTIEPGKRKYHLSPIKLLLTR